MKKHFVYSIVFGILISGLWGLTNTIFAQGSNTNGSSLNGNGNSQAGGGLNSGTQLNSYYPTNGPLQIIKKTGSYIYGEKTKVVFSFDMSDEKTYGNVFQKFQISLNENATAKKAFSGDFSIDGSKMLPGVITGLTPNTDYTLFIKPYVAGTPRDVQMTIGVATTNNSTVIKSFTYTKNASSIILDAIIEGVPSDSTVTFDIVSGSGLVNKKDLDPTKTTPISTTTKQYTYTESDISLGAYTVTVTLKLKDGGIVTQSKTSPDTVDGNIIASTQQTNSQQSGDDYQFLTKLPGFNMASLCKEKDAKGNCLVYNFNEYLQALIKLTYSIIALIAVFQIIYYGIKTMLSATPFGKADSRVRVENAIMGIVIALGSYLILYTINPKLVTIHLGAPKVDIYNKNQDLLKSIETYSAATLDTASKAKIDALKRYDDFYGWPVGGSSEVSQAIHYSRGNESIDIIASNKLDGAPILASADGTVENGLFTTGCVAGNSACGQGYGNFLEIKHSNGTKTAYAHMKEIKVTAGQNVKKGDQIGVMGTTGLSTGPHLHFEVIDSRVPLSFLNK